MDDKLDMLEQDIISLLHKHEPNMLRWTEIVETLWQTYQIRYKDKKGFGVAVTNKLNILVAKSRINKEAHFYGTLNSITPDAMSSIENNTKAQAELNTVRTALERLQRDFTYFREPTLQEVSCRAGKPPVVVEPILYALANESGWRPQENPMKEAENAINLAGWLCWKQKGEQYKLLEGLSAEAINSASSDTRKRAEKILKTYPDLVPKVEGQELQWPEETNKKWRQIFGSRPPSPPYWGSGVFLVHHPPRF